MTERGRPGTHIGLRHVATRGDDAYLETADICIIGAGCERRRDL